mgnify:CR=1 FL=1
MCRRRRLFVYVFLSEIESEKLCEALRSESGVHAHSFIYILRRTPMVAGLLTRGGRSRSAARRRTVTSSHLLHRSQLARRQQPTGYHPLQVPSA